MIKSISKLSFPVVIAQLAFAFMSFIDTLLMGLMGVEVLAGGGLGAVVYQFFYIVGIGALVATANLIAFAKGRSDNQEIHRALLSGVVLVGILFCVFALAIWQSRSILLIFGQDPVTVEFAYQYLSVAVWALLPAFGFILLRSLVLGVGRPAAILPISLIAASLNYPVSYVLMTGMFGLPALGIEGVALGTCIISWLMLFGLAILVYRQAYFKSFPFWTMWRNFSSRQLFATLKLGFPIALAHAMEVGMFSAAALLIGLIGVEALAAHQIALQLTTLSFMIPLGISQAVSVKVGVLFGAGEVDKIFYALRSGVCLALISACISGGFFLLVPDLLVQIFLSRDVVGAGEYITVLNIAVSILFVAAIFQLVDGVQVVIMGSLRGFKLGLSPTVAAIVSYWCVGIPCSYFLLGDYGAKGVWMGMGLGLAFSSVILIFIFFRQLRLHHL